MTSDLPFGNPAPICWGYKLPSCGGVLCPPEWANPSTIDELASAALGAGFELLWLHDHLLLPQELSHLDRPNFFEPLITATRLASVFPRAIIGIATVVLPFREPVLLAKQIATMGTFYPGRIIIGLGIGRYESEFEAAGHDLFHVRGKVADEYLEIIRALFEQHSVDHEGTHRRLRGAVMYPKPAPGDPALWIAGNSPAGARRAGRFGDGWIAAAVPPAEVSALLASIQEGRPTAAPRPFTVALSATIKRSEGGGDHAPDGGLHTHASAISGDAAKVAAELAEYVSIGVTHFLLSLGVGSLERVHEDIDWFASEVIPLVGRVAESRGGIPSVLST